MDRTEAGPILATLDALRDWDSPGRLIHRVQTRATPPCPRFSGTRDMTLITRRSFALALGAADIVAPAVVRGASPDLSKVTLRIGDQVGQHRSKLQAAGLLADVPYKIEWSAYPAAFHLHEDPQGGGDRHRRGQ